jgi:hypothetical protein
MLTIIYTYMLTIIYKYYLCSKLGISTLSLLSYPINHIHKSRKLLEYQVYNVDLDTSKKSIS